MTEKTLPSGLYVIFEGGEGTGKTSTMKAVANEVLNRTVGAISPRLTHHPGSTPLGKYLRKLVKFPHEIDPEINMDPLTRQCLYMADTINFITTVLKPALEVRETVFADRSSFISGLVYGLADGIDVVEVCKLLQLIIPPRADRVYILQCPWQVSKSRCDSTRGETGDYYDSQPNEFFQKVQTIYDGLLTGSAEQTVMVSRVAALDNFVYIDASQDQEKVVSDIVADLNSVIDDRSI